MRKFFAIFISLLAGCSSTATRADPYEARCGSAEGYFFSDRERLPPDFERDYLENAPIDAMECRAAAGDYYAQYNLGRLYLEGKRVPLDYKKARQLFLQAAEPSENPDVFLSRSFGRLPDIQINHEETKGFAPAQYALGLMHYTGLGGPKDIGEGLRWITMAAELGNREARDFLKKIGVK